MQTVLYVRHTLRPQPQRVILKQSLPGKLLASWKDNETELWRTYGPQVTYHVVFHEENGPGLGAFT
jgi:hypothetical protein